MNTGKRKGNAMASRREKYPETSTFHYHNQNPKGRITGDCFFRAISYATGIQYEQVVRDYAEVVIESGYRDTKSQEILLAKYGWKKCAQPKHSNGKKYTVKEFVKAFKDDVYIINMANHLSVVEYGVNIDIWDCVKFGGCVGNYFVKG